MIQDIDRVRIKIDFGTVDEDGGMIVELSDEMHVTSEGPMSKVTKTFFIDFVNQSFNNAITEFLARDEIEANK